MSANSTNKKLFNAFPLTIRELFGDAKSYYQIPEYQRHYKWGDTQLDALLSDLKDAYEKDTDYFLGAIITTDPKEGDIYKDVVDGQQRITTLMILFCVIRDVYSDINKDDKSTSAIHHEDIIDCIAKKTERLRFYTHPGNQTDFNTIILEEGATNKELIKPDTKNIEKADDPQFNFTNSAFFFKTELKKLNQLGKFINFLFDKVEVVVMNCDNVDSAIKLFQVINTRGLSLTHADLTKSFLLGQIKDRNNNLEIIAKHKEWFKSDWKDIENHMKDPDYDIYMDELLSLYQYYSQAKEHGKTLYATLVKFFTPKFNLTEPTNGPKNPNEVIAEIKSFSQNYLNLCNEKKNREIFSLRYTPWSMLWKSIILTAIHKDYKDIDELQKELRKFHYIHWISGKRLSHIRSPSFRIIKAIKGEASIKSEASAKDIFKYAYEESDYDENDLIKKVYENLQADDIASEKWCKPLLLLIEHAMAEDGMQSFIKLDKNIHLEHIMPKENRDGWAHISDKTHEKYLNSAGNLTLLTGKKNIAASNKSFHEKMKEYAGNKDTKITSFNISRDILDAYKKEQEWGKDAMEARKEWFIKKVSKALDIEN